MRKFVPVLRSEILARAAFVVLGASALGACSSDTSRFGDPFGNPFSTSEAEPAPKREPQYTGGIQAAPSSRVERAPLAAPSAAQNRPLRGYDQNADSGYRPSSSEPRTTGALPPVQGGVKTATSWSSSGGTAITVGRGETVNTLANRYGVPASAILQANNLQSANLTPGQQLIIPVYAGAAAHPVAPAPVAPRMAEAPAAKPVPAREGKMQFVTGPQAKGMEPAKTAAAPALKPSVPAPAEDKQAFAAAPKPATSAPQPNDSVKTASLKVEEPAQAAAPAGPSFRWPVRGRVISGYGSKASGASNDGVNIAVPEGTEVKASDDGVVAYAGNELKGFGNLVLIRHSNGWVTAYAHNSALDVKRGDSVRRGQVIAKSGASGNVTTPQLHFEVRKGSATVNPLDHLPNA
jgi:murein DD-endopeptidase MepM/ murein hydrolase activator NlpD